jgi:ParB/RepB/Spo0J family partition protein
MTIAGESRDDRAGGPIDGPASGALAGAILEVPWQAVRPMPGQPREHFDRSALEALASSIRSIGQVVPALVVRLVGDERFGEHAARVGTSRARAHDYEIVDGQRRWHAVQMAGVPALRVEVIDEPDEGRRYVRSVVANLSRVGHHPIEVAVACDRMRRSKDPATGRPMTLEKTAETLGRSVVWVQSHLSLLNLCDAARAALHPTVPKSRKLPLTTAFELARQPKGLQEVLLREIFERRSAGYSTGGAARRVLATAHERGGTSPSARKGKDKRSSYQKFKGLLRFLRDAAEGFDDLTPDRFDALVGGRPAEDVQVVWTLLGRIAAKVEELEGFATGDGAGGGPVTGTAIGDDGPGR